MLDVWGNQRSIQPCRQDCLATCHSGGLWCCLAGRAAKLFTFEMASPVPLDDQELPTGTLHGDVSKWCASCLLPYSVSWSYFCTPKEGPHFGTYPHWFVVESQVHQLCRSYQSINQFVSMAGVDYSVVDETIWRTVTKAPCGIFKFTGNCPFRCWPTETI